MTPKELAKIIGCGVTAKMLSYAAQHYSRTIDELADELEASSPDDIQYYIVDLYRDR